MAAVLAGVMAVGMPASAWAGTASGGALYCSSNMAVQIYSKSSGYTYHFWNYNGTDYSEGKSIPSSDPGWRTYTTRRTVSSWSVSAPVLETGLGQCSLVAILP